MSLLQLIYREGKPCALPVRVCNLSAGSKVDVLSPDPQLPETHPGEPGTDRDTKDMAGESETVIVLTLKHKGELPEGLNQALERRAYDLAQTKGQQVDVTSRVWYALSVKEMQ